MTDKFAGSNPGINGVPTGAIDIGAGDDNNDLSTFCRCLIPGTDGDVAVTLYDGTEVTLPALRAGVQYWAYVKRVKATGTTATGIVGLY